MITQELLKKLLHYNPDTGIFTWIASRPKVVAGQKAGSRRRDGYIVVSVLNQRYLAHRLAWLYLYGYIPECDIDHRDGDTSNNCIGNLREATRSQNISNGKHRKNNTSRIKGVSFCKRYAKWEVQVMLYGKRVFHRRFDCLEDAASAAESARELHHKTFARHK